MIWYLFFQCLASLGFVGLVYGAFKLRRDKLEFLDEWLMKHKKHIFILWLVVLSIATIVMAPPLWRTASCQFDSWSIKAETTYSWYKGECLFKTKTGAWLPLRLNRDAPEGDSNIQP